MNNNSTAMFHCLYCIVSRKGYAAVKLQIGQVKSPQTARQTADQVPLNTTGALHTWGIHPHSQISKTHENQSARPSQLQLLHLVLLLLLLILMLSAMKAASCWRHVSGIMQQVRIHQQQRQIHRPNGIRSCRTAPSCRTLPVCHLVI